MLEAIVKVMFGGSCLLLAAVFLRRDLFLTPELELMPRIKPTINNHNSSKLVNTSTCEDNLRTVLERSVSQWDPILINFLVNQRGVNVALASTDDLYLQLKALEFCTENAAILQLQSLEQLERDCAIPVLSVFRSKLQNGDYLHPIARNVPVADTASETAADTIDSSSASTSMSKSSDSTSNEPVEVYSDSATRKDETEVEATENKENEEIAIDNIPEHALAAEIAEVALQQSEDDHFLETSSNIAGESIVSADEQNASVESDAQTLEMESAPTLLEEELKLKVETIETLQLPIPENDSSEEELTVSDERETAVVYETVEEKP